MKKLLTATILVLNLVLVTKVWADQASEQTESLQKQLIKIKCSNIKTQIQKINLNDSLTRVNYGQMYESIITDLMVPVNTRLIVNRYSDKTDLLVKQTSKFEKSVIEFRQDYNDYQSQMEKLTKTDCQQSTDQFYDYLVEAQQKRAKIHQKTEQLEQQYQAYQALFKEIANEQAK